MSERRTPDLDQLFEEFQTSYVETAKGIAHLGGYATAREQARKNWQDVTAAKSRGEDVTDLVLERLLPYKDTAHNRNSGVWVHVAPAITRDLKKWFQNTGWMRAEDWPEVAVRLVEFIRQAIETPADLGTTCDEFAASPYSKGMQSAFLSPVLNALRPDLYLIVNQKSRKALRFLTGSRCRQRLTRYPESNEALRHFLGQVRPSLAEIGGAGVLDSDVLDAFYHWLVAIKRVGKATGPPHPKGPIDRYDPASASQVLAALFKQPESRRACMSAFADAIEFGNKHGGMRWGVSLFRGRISLNLGKLLAFQLRRDRVRIGLAPHAIDEKTLSMLRLKSEISAFATTPATALYSMSAATFLESRPQLQEAFQEFARIAAATARKNPNASSHSPAVVTALNAELGRDLPQPIYSSESGVPSAMEAAIAIQTPRTVFRRVDYDVAGLLNYVENGDIGLPDIQRPFVWSTSKVRDLFDSMYRGFPVGYLLFWENSEIQGTKAIGLEDKARKVPSLLIVDGQQRLTSLYAVIKGKKVVDDSFRETTIEIAFRPRDGSFAVCDAATRQDPEFIPNISILWTGKSSYMLVSEFLKSLESKRSIQYEDKEAISHNLDRLFDLLKYPFTALEIVPQVDEEAVADIFVRINSEGVKLLQADFILTLLSVFWDEGRAALEDFSRRAKRPAPGKEPSPFNYLIEPSPSQLLRAGIAVGFHRARLRSVYQVLRGKDLETGLFTPDRRDAQFARLKDAQVSVLDLNHWHQFLGILAAAGYRNSSMISSKTALIYSYSLYLIGKLQGGVDERVLLRLIGRWFFMSSLTRRYTSSPESVMESDLARFRGLSRGDAFREVLEKIIDNSLTTDFWEIALPTDLETSSTRNPAWLAFVAAQNKLGSPVLFSDKRLWEAMDPSLRPTRKPLEAHHLFPRAWLQRNGFPEAKRINQVANLAHIEWPDNAKIGANPPQEYVPLIAKHFSAAVWERMARDHALPPGWHEMAYLDFLDARRKSMAQVIRRGFDALASLKEEDVTEIKDGNATEQVIWTSIQALEKRLRRLVRAKYFEKWGAAADSKMQRFLGESAWATIERNRDKYVKQYRASPPADGMDVLDFCYLGQLVQLAIANEAWEMFREPFRDRRELDDLMHAIIPVRNDQAHFRTVPQKELERCRIAVDDLAHFLGKL